MAVRTSGATNASRDAAESTAAESTAAEVLELVRARSRDAEAEVTVRSGTSALTRFATGFIHQNVAEDLSHVLVRLAADGHVAAVTLDGPTDRDHLGRLVGNAFDAALAMPVDPDWPGVTPPTAGLAVDHWDEATAAASADDRAGRVRAFVDAAGGLETAGYCSTLAVELTFANTAGQSLRGRATAAALDGIARTATADGSGHDGSVRLGDLEGRVVGERAARKARDASNPTDLEPGRYEVVLEPDCVANILSFLLVHGFNGKAVEEGRSFAEIGAAQFDGKVSLRDDVTDAHTTGIAFDVEGTPKRPFDLVRDGVTRALLHTRRTARAMGAASTGHAVEGGAAWGALGANLVLEPGDRSVDELVAGVERGILVTDFWYTRILDPRTQVVTGLTRNGVWLVEDGRVVRPVTNLRFTQSFVDALGPGNVRGISSDQALLQAGWDSIYVVPALHLASWNFTGGAKG
ncbi:MAG TPA: TldD/PmbA family protein [Candidatus Limnocylindrales bacterium]|nr:TldD/PmbA family protein [Candidatus Limnocylindrales bacterium]